jgi:hypothetical protein
MAWAIVLIELVMLFQLPYFVCLLYVYVYVSIFARAYFVIVPWLFNKHADKQGIEINWIIVIICFVRVDVCFVCLRELYNGFSIW